MRIMMAVLLCTFTGCTENEMAKNFGGSLKVDVPCGEKVYDVTWKDGNFWYASRPMLPGETAQTSHFREKSSWGSLEGEVVLVESLCN